MAGFIFLFCLASNANSQSIHSELKKPHLLKRFKDVSSRLMCQCGCKMTLNQCNHLTCMAWSMRSAIDHMILNGYSDDHIVNGFRSGFHDTAKSFKFLQKEIYKELLVQYENGFGDEVLSQPENANPGIMIFIFSFISIMVVSVYMYKRR